MAKGKLIVVEGACDGIGKTTQYEMLCSHLKEDGINLVNHHFPSYNTYGRLRPQPNLSFESSFFIKKIQTST